MIPYFKFARQGTGLGTLPPEISYIESHSNNSSSFSATANFGAEADDRVIIICTGTDNHVSSVTVAGQAATQRASITNSVGTSRQTSIWTVSLPTGTSGTVALGGSFATNGAFHVYRAVNLTSEVPTDTAGAGVATTGVLNLDIPENSVAVGVVRSHDDQPVTWTGLVEDSDFSNGGISGRQHSTASQTFESAETNRTIEVDAPGSTAGRASAAVWA